MTTKTEMPVQIFWITRKELPRVVEIDNAAYPGREWTQEDFTEVLRKRNCIAQCAATGLSGDPLGFVVYELNKKVLSILNIAVDPAHHRRGIGRQIVERLKLKLSQQRRHEIRLRIRDDNLGGQLFFGRQGFLCIGTEREHYVDGADAYLLRYVAADCEPVVEQPRFVNRIASLLDGEL